MYFNTYILIINYRTSAGYTRKTGVQYHRHHQSAARDKPNQSIRHRQHQSAARAKTNPPIRHHRHPSAVRAYSNQSIRHHHHHVAVTEPKPTNYSGIATTNQPSQRKLTNKSGNKTAAAGTIPFKSLSPSTCTTAVVGNTAVLKQLRARLPADCGPIRR